MKNKKYIIIGVISILALFLFFSNSPKNDDEMTWSKTYTLYRTGTIYPDMRIHIATFEAKVGDKFFNKDNCEFMALSLNKQTSINKFWCETGTYQKN